MINFSIKLSKSQCRKRNILIKFYINRKFCVLTVFMAVIIIYRAILAKRWNNGD